MQICFFFPFVFIPSSFLLVTEMTLDKTLHCFHRFLSEKEIIVTVDHLYSPVKKFGGSFSNYLSISPTLRVSHFSVIFFPDHKAQVPLCGLSLGI